MSRVLIVDDNAVFRQVLKDLLGSNLQDISLEEAGSAEEALQRTAEVPPDLILTDVRLHKGNGLELVREIKKLDRGVAVFIISDYDSPEYHEAALEAGADNFLSKRRSSPTEIVQAVESAIGGPVNNRAV
jgi:DNA-binding NarL/FixJ family response regulator